MNNSLNIINTSIVERLVQDRIQAGIAVAEIAEAIGISENEYTSYENHLIEMPASIVYLVSIILVKDPLFYLNQFDLDQSHKNITLENAETVHNY